jgi:diadenosine tetraphosphate (Ap4A) HIT family hydrolase
MMNETIVKFGYPATLITEYDHWLVLLRPAQPTLGALILAAKSNATAFGALPAAAHAELAPITAAIESALGAAVDYARINYLMLMMVDPHVHFHVIPRYEGERTARGVGCADAGWPGVPQLGEAIALDPAQIENLVDWVKGYWPA